MGAYNLAISPPQQGLNERRGYGRREMYRLSKGRVGRREIRDDSRISGAVKNSTSDATGAQFGLRFSGTDALPQCWVS